MAEKRTAILHLGTYKTGSSSLQNTLYANRDALFRAGVLYPEAGLVKNPEVGHRHRRLLARFMRDEAAPYAMRSLRRELKETPHSKVVISSEAWSHPRYLPMLGGFTTELADIGFDRIAGIAFLRRLSDYKVSYYRQFTMRRGNAVPYPKYVHLQGQMGVFDYLHIARNFHAIFGEALTVLNYAQTGDTTSRFMQAAGLQGILPATQNESRANVKSDGALGAEVLRRTNKHGIEPAQGRVFLAYFRERHPDLFVQNWTERVAPEQKRYGRGYRSALAQVLGWPRDEVQALLEDRPVEGRPVAEASKIIETALKDWRASQGSSPAA
ncbi:hypothetical protein NHG85_00415 [Limimaricola sp. ASW11-118]|uniref:Sulfotransferase family protein n=1 Tax=Limimaricola litoreus TaxID=2955316 RepID=A0A9X2FRT4_9RHOB|nr:hypothetical protein [Limimaricola litoreus]MCP1167001.1 hypothetical protein [Limimaricola litoreus]